MESLYFWEKLFFRLEGDFKDLKEYLEEKNSSAKNDLEMAASKVLFLGSFIDLLPWSRATQASLCLERLTEQYDLVCELIVLYGKIRRGLQQGEYRVAYQELCRFKATCRNQKETLMDLRRGCVSYLALMGRAEELSKAVFAELIGQAELVCPKAAFWV